MRRKDREVKSNDELNGILDAGKMIQIAFIDGCKPYIVTLSYGFIQESGRFKLYFHSAREGRKVNCIMNNPEVCFSVSLCDAVNRGEKACSFGMKFRSLVGYGRIHIIEDRSEKISGLNLLMKKYSGRTNWEYDERMLENTLVFRLDVETLTGKCST